METRPALYTTEFWIHFVLQVFFVLNTAHIWTFMPPRYSGLIQAIMAAAYMASRGIAKSGSSIDPTVPANTKFLPKQSDMIQRPRSRG